MIFDCRSADKKIVLPQKACNNPAIEEFKAQVADLRGSGRLGKTAANRLVDCYVLGLEELDWSGLGLQELPVDLLATCETLRKLNLSNNCITTIPDDIGKLHQVSLDLANNQLSDPELNRLPHLLHHSCKFSVKDEFGLHASPEGDDITLQASGNSTTFKRHLTAPIRELSNDEYLQALDELTHDYKFWKDGWQETEQGDWENRFWDTDRMVFDILKRPAFRRSDLNALAYFARGGPIGILTFKGPGHPSDPTDSVYVLALVTHPGTVSVGGALIEKAVAISVATNRGGKLSLQSLSPTSTKAYLALGFEDHGEFEAMSLDPAQSAKWHQVNGDWRLKSSAGQRFLG
jgi:hypothetical protein